MNKRGILAVLILVGVLGVAGWQTAGLLPSAITGLITAGTNITITGSGTLASPYSISSSGAGGTFPAAVTVSGTGVTEIDFIPGTNQCFSASYQHYIISFYDLQNTGTAANFGLQIYTGGAFDTTTGHYAEGRAIAQLNANTTGLVQAGTGGGALFDLGAANSSTASNTVFYRGSIEVMNPLSGTNRQAWTGDITQYDSSSQNTYHLNNGYFYTQTTSVTGFRVYAGGQTFSGTVTCQPMPH